MPYRSRPGAAPTRTLGPVSDLERDFRADAVGTIQLLEASPNPGWCWGGKRNLMAELAGLGDADLLRLILEATLERVAVEQAEAALA